MKVRRFGENSVALISCLFLGLALVPAKSFASTFADCYESRIFWSLSIGSPNPKADHSHLDEAAKFLSRGESYDSWQLRFLTRGKSHDGKLMERPEGLKLPPAMLAFEDALKSQKDFIPNFRERVKELSGGLADIIPIAPDEFVKVPKPDAIYFQLIRYLDHDIKENIVVLTPKGFSIVPISGLKSGELSRARQESEMAKKSLSLPESELKAAFPAEKEQVAAQAAKEFWLPILRDSRKSGRGSRAADRYSVVKDMTVDASNLDRALVLLNQGQSYGATSIFLRVFNNREELVPNLQKRIRTLSNGKSDLRLLATDTNASYFTLIRHTDQGTDELAVKLTQEGFIVRSPSNEADTALSSTTLPTHLRGMAEAHFEKSVVGSDQNLDLVAKFLANAKPINRMSVRRLEGAEFTSARNALDSFLNAPKDFIPKLQERVKAMSGETSELSPIVPEEAVKAPKSGVVYFKLVRKSADGDRAFIVTLTDQGFGFINPSETLLKKNPSRRPNWKKE